VQENYQKTRTLLAAHKGQLIALSEALLERETLDGAEIRKITFPEESEPEVAASAEVVEPSVKEERPDDTGEADS
jgi:hypothetical protein